MDKWDWKYPKEDYPIAWKQVLLQLTDRFYTIGFWTGEVWSTKIEPIRWVYICE